MTRRPHLPPLRGLPAQTLHAGELACQRGAAVLSTVLGSCVAVTMLAPRTGHYAMCHVQFPEYPGDPPERRFYYADEAVRRMAAFFREAGVEPGEVAVKVFGGADVLEAVTPGKAGSVGQLNLEAVLRELFAGGFIPQAADVRGRQGRRLFFFTDSGEVLLRRLRKTKMHFD